MCPALQKSTPGPSADPRFSTIHLAVPEASACRQTIAQLLDIYSTMFYVSLFDLHTRNAQLLRRPCAAPQEVITHAKP